MASFTFKMQVDLHLRLNYEYVRSHFILCFDFLRDAYRSLCVACGAHSQYFCISLSFSLSLLFCLRPEVRVRPFSPFYPLAGAFVFNTPLLLRLVQPLLGISSCLQKVVFRLRTLFRTEESVNIQATCHFKFKPIHIDLIVSLDGSELRPK